jgi:hypothetical protein
MGRGIKNTDVECDVEREGVGSIWIMSRGRKKHRC